MQSLVDQIAKSVMSAEPADLSALVDLQDQLHQLTEACEGPDLAPLADVARSAAELVESIILRETEDEDGALELLRSSIDQIQQILDETTVEGASGDTTAANEREASGDEGAAETSGARTPTIDAVDIATDTLSALQAAEARVFDAVILDLRLATESGLQLIVPLKAACPVLRILLRTGYASIASEVEAI